jgi:hypothetical protein
MEQYPLFESESFPGGIEISKDICSNGCRCQSSSDHNFVMEEIDFDQ